MRVLCLTLLVGLLSGAMSRADEVRIVDATAQLRGASWSFAVTLSHADSGWEHYADAWRVTAADGTVLGTRTLFHPHVNEQPFTRSLDGVIIADPATPVYIEAHDTVHGWAGPRFEVRLPAR